MNCSQLLHVDGPNLPDDVLKKYKDRPNKIRISKCPQCDRYLLVIKRDEVTIPFPAGLQQ